MKCTEPGIMNQCVDLTIILNNSRAFKCLKTAADQKHAKANLQLGSMYRCGYGIQKDDVQGERYYKTLVHEGLEICSRIPLLYHTNESMQNLKRVHKWYKHFDTIAGKRKSGEYRKPDSRLFMRVGVALLYECGDGVEQTFDKALKCCGKFYSRNYQIGYLRMALTYYYGKGVPINYDMSFRILKRECTQPNNTNYMKLPYVDTKGNANGNNSRVLHHGRYRNKS